jgi:hypothetical protein
VFRFFRKIRADFEPVVALWRSKIVYEATEIDTLAGKGFIRVQVREHPQYKLLYSLVAKGGEATVYVVFTREQFARFAAQASEIANKPG